MDKEEKYCKECGKFIFELDSENYEYCDDCKEGTETLRRLREQWVISEEDWVESTDFELDKETIEEFERELSSLEKEIFNINNELLEYFKESDYPQEKYEKIQNRMEKIKRILKVD